MYLVYHIIYLFANIFMKKNNLGFTIVEILIVVVLLSIIAVWLSQISFMPQVNNQNSESFTNSVYTNIENIRNNAYLWKGAFDGSELIHPQSWKVNIEIGTWVQNITAQYLSGSDWYIYNDFKVDFVTLNSYISQIECKKINSSDSLKLNSGAVNIVFNGDTTTFTECANTLSGWILEISTRLWDFTKKIQINAITGVMNRP